VTWLVILSFALGQISRPSCSNAERGGYHREIERWKSALWTREPRQSQATIRTLA
jgi:hypothetical protein